MRKPRKIMDLTCKICGSDFSIPNSSFENSYYTFLGCSTKCRLTEEYKKIRKEEQLIKRGFPDGFNSKSNYETHLKNEEIIEKMCPCCGIIFTGKRKELRVGCSIDCIKKIRVLKIQNTKIERYGDKNYRDGKKTKKTLLKKYGNENFNNREKFKQTCIEKYGFENSSSSPIIKERIKEGFLKRYGVDNGFKSEEVKEKIRTVLKNKYGVKYISQVPEIRKKQQDSLKKKYKEDIQGCVVKSSLEKTNLERYGTKQFFSSDKGKMSRENLIKSFGYSEEEVTSLFKRRDSSSFNWALKKSEGNIEVAHQIFEAIKLKRLPQLFKASKSSLKVFIPLYKVLRNLGMLRTDINFGISGSKEYFIYDKENKTIYFYDFTILSLNLIIEFNGTYWHPKEDNINLNKSINIEDSIKRLKQKIELAKLKGFTIIEIWDDKSEKENLIICLTVLQEKLNEVSKVKED